MSRETNMTVGRPTKLILGLAVPLILTNVGQQLYTVADASIVGRGVGVEALAALGATDWLYWLVLWTVQAMTQGFSVLVSQTFGSNDKKGLRKAITMSVLLCAAVGILLTVVFVSSAGWLLHLLDTPENIYDGAHIYLTMMYAGTLITMAYNMAAAILRALGDGKSPLIAMFTAGCLNMCSICCSLSASAGAFRALPPRHCSRSCLHSRTASLRCGKSRLRPSKSRTGSRTAV
ncbi:MAG: MATE family efflux transporter [Butyricicoccus sp.]